MTTPSIAGQDDNQYKIRLTAGNPTDVRSLRSQSVVFDVSPELVENRNVTYKTYDPVHAPGQIYVYANTSSRTFQLSAIKLISRTPREASENLARLWTMRSWLMPNFGRGVPLIGQSESDRVSAQTDNQLSVREMIRQMSEAPGTRRFVGAPPPVLRLSAYSGIGGIGHIRNVPVVITQMSIPYPSDTDYIPTAEELPTPMPTLMTMDIQLTETHSPNEYETFDLQQFKTGDLSGF